MTKSHATSCRPDLAKLGLRELQALFAEILGESTRCPNRVFLERKIRARWAKDDATSAATVATEAGAAERRPAGEDSVGAVPVMETVAAAAMTSTPAVVERPGATPAAPARDGRRLPRGRFSSMTLEELQATYSGVVGRPSDSVHRGYLQWKIREAEKGRIPVGPRKVRQRVGDPVDVKILPLRVESVAVDRMDEAWRTRGIKSRMEFLRRAVGHYLEHIGANEAAALFATGTDGAS
jgi:hypothetical protein